MSQYAWEDPATAREAIVDLRSENSHLKSELAMRERIIQRFVAERDASPEQKISADYLRGFQDARKTLRIWFRDAVTAMESRFELDLANIPQDPGIAPLPEKFNPEITARLNYK